MRRLVIVLALVLSAIVPASAELDSACNVAAQHARTDFRLAQVAHSAQVPAPSGTAPPQLRPSFPSSYGRPHKT